MYPITRTSDRMTKDQRQFIAAFNDPDGDYWKNLAQVVANKAGALVEDDDAWRAFVAAPPESWFDAQTWMQIYERWQRLYQALRHCQERPVTAAWLLDRFGYTA